MNGNEVTREIPQQTAASAKDVARIADSRTHDALRVTLREVERDEAEAISTLCALLERVEESRDFSCLGDIRNVVKEWQNRPPRGIVTDLMKIRETLKCQDHDNT